MTRAGATALVRALAQAKAAATLAGCHEVLAFVTSAVRDAEIATAVLARVHAETGVRPQVMSSEDEPATSSSPFAAGMAGRPDDSWSSTSGAGSLELAAGRDENPEVALSLPLGAGRLTRQWVQRRPTQPRRCRRGGPRTGRRPRPGRPAGAQGGAV